MRHLNDLQCDMFKKNSFHVISNEDIIRILLRINGIHLNDSGTNIWAEVISDYKNKIIFYMENADWHDKIYGKKHDIVGTTLAHKSDYFSNLEKIKVDLNELI